MVARVGRFAIWAAALLTSAALAQNPEPQGNPLSEAVFGNRLEEVRKLLEEGGDPDTFNNNQYSLLTIASVRGYPQIVRLLLDYGARPDKFSRSGPPLLYASAQPQLECQKLLISAGADIRAESENGNEVLHFAATKNLGDSVDLLISAGAKIDAKNKKGQSALMAAAAIGAIDAVKRLLAAHADALLKDGEGKTALDQAKAKGHQEIIRLLESHLMAESPALAAGDLVDVRPGEDLAAAIGRANPGTTIRLSAGEYRCRAMAGKKRLTIQGDAAGATILVGQDTDTNFILGAVDGAEVILNDLRFKISNPKQLAVYAAQSKVRMNRCVIENAPQDAIYLEQSTLTMSQCQLKAIGRAGILALKQSTLRIRESQIEDVKQTAIHAQDGGNVTVLNCQLKNIDGGGILAMNDSKLEVRHCTLRDVKQMGMAAQKSKSLVAVENEFRRCGQAIDARQISQSAMIRDNVILESPANAVGIAVNETATAAVTDNQIAGGSTGIVITGTMTRPAGVARNIFFRPAKGGIYLECKISGGQTAARVAGNIVCEPGSFGLLADGKCRVVMTDNRVMSQAGKTLAVSFQNEATGLLEGNLLAATQGSVNYYKTDGAKSWSRGDLRFGAVLSDKSRPRATLLDSQLDVVLSQTGSGAELDKTIKQLLAAAAPGAELPKIGDALTQLEQRITQTRQAVKTLGSVKFIVEDAVGRRIGMDYQVFDGTSPTTGSLTLWSGDIKEPASLIAVLRDDKTPAGKYFQQSMADDLKQRLSALKPGAAPDEDLLAALAEHLNRQIEGAAIADADLLKALNPGEADARQLADLAKLSGADQSRPENRQQISRLNRRLIEQAFPTQLSKSETLARGAADQPVHLKPGKYWLVAQDDPEIRILATVEADRITESVSPVQGSMWLRFGMVKKDAPIEWHLIRFKPRQAIQRVVKDLRMTGVDNSFYWPRRPDVTGPAAQAARQLALANLEPAFSEFKSPENAKEEEINKAWTRRDRARTDVLRILFAVGQAEDVRAFLDIYAKTRGAANDYESIPILKALAAVEARCGVLENGELMKIASAASDPMAPSAAAALMSRGVSNPALRQTILAALRNTDRFPSGELSAPLLAEPLSADEMQAMRSIWQRAVELQHKHSNTWSNYYGQDATYPVLAALLAYGDLEDLKSIGKMTLRIGHASWLAYLAEDPLAPLQVVITNEHYWHADRAGQTALDRPAREAMAIYRRICSAVTNDYAMRASHWQDQQSRQYNRYRQTQMLMSYFMPSTLAASARRTAEFKIDDNSIISDLPWWHFPEFIDDAVKYWLKGSFAYVDQFDYVDHATLRQSIQKAGGPMPVDFDLKMAAFQVGSQAHWYQYRTYPLGADQLAYCFKHMETDANGAGMYGGGISGVASLILRRDGDRLQLWIKLNQETDYHDIGTLAGIIDRNRNLPSWEHHRYVIQYGRNLIDSVVLRRGEKAVTAADTGATINGWHVFVAPADLKTDPAQLLVDVNLALVKQKTTLTWPAYLGENGPSLREAFRQAITDPSPEALRVLLARGDDAAATAIFDKLPGVADRPQAWRVISDAMIARLDYPAAADWLNKAVARRPADQDLRRQLVRCLLLAGRPDQAIAAAGSVDDPEILQHKAMCQWISDRATDATATLGRIAPDQSPQSIGLMRLLAAVDTGEFRKTAEALAPLADSGKSDPVYLPLRAALGRSSNEEIEQADRDPLAGCRLRLALGIRAMGEKRPNEAIEHFKSAIEHRTPQLPEHALAAFLLKKVQSTIKPGP